MVMVGAAAIAIVVVLVIMMRSGGEDDSNETTDKPAVSDNNTPRVVQPASSGPATAGKAPARPAPELTHETLAKLDQILVEARSHNHEGVKKRNAGDNMGARDAQAKAKALLDQWEELVKDQLLWQEEAEFGDWAQPAEYDLLTRRYPKFSKLQKSVRMGGGK